MSAAATGTTAGPSSSPPGGAPAPRSEVMPAAAASVLVEVGDGKGALVLHLDEGFRGREVEISRVGSVQRVHTGVHERETPQRRLLVAVFGSIPAGEYVVWRDQQTSAGTVVVVDGEVTLAATD